MNSLLQTSPSIPWEKNPTSRGYRPRGGQDGIVVTIDQLVQFARYLGNKYIDQCIPLPDLTLAQQVKKLSEIPEAESSLNEATYYETETGEHGWCCSWTGRVLQWG